MVAPFLSPPVTFDALWRRTHSDSAINQSAAMGGPQAMTGVQSGGSNMPQTFLTPSRFDQPAPQQQNQNQQSSPSHRASTPTAVAAANAGAPSYLHHRELAIASKPNSYFAVPNTHGQTNMQQLPACHPTSVRSRSCEISPSPLRNALSNGATQCSNDAGNSMNGVDRDQAAAYGASVNPTLMSNCGQYLSAGGGPNWGGAPASTYLSTPNIAYLTSVAGSQQQQSPNQLCVGVAMPGSQTSGSASASMYSTPSGAQYMQNSANVQPQQAPGTLLLE